MPRPRTAGPSDHEPTFEQAMTELEEIVGVLEDSSLPLEQLVEKYERGAALHKICRQRLDAAQQRIELITRNASSGVQLASAGDFEVETAPAAKPGRKISSPDHVHSDEIRLF
jgi:exodeoxyribonuclease VII small subunit